MAVFEDSTGRDLSQFKIWYEQAGTPRLSVHDSFENGRYILHFKQHTPETPGQIKKDPRVIPIAVGLLDATGKEVQATTVLEMDQREMSFSFDGLNSRPFSVDFARLFRAGYSESRRVSNDRLAFLLAHDTDPFNKWAAGEALGRNVLVKMVIDDSPPETAFFGCPVGGRAERRSGSQFSGIDAVFAQRR